MTIGMGAQEEESDREERRREASEQKDKTRLDEIEQGDSPT